MDVVVVRCAGLDVGKDEVVACVRILSEGKAGAVRRYALSRPSRRAWRHLPIWLAAEEVSDVALEATGKYWKPVWYLLEDHQFDLKLVNARHVKIMPGRKTDPL